MAGLGTDIGEVADALDEAGVRVCIDLRDLNPPCAFVTVDRLDFDQLTATTATWTIWAVAPNVGRARSLELLGPLIESIRAVWPARFAEFVDLADPAGGDPLPAARLSVITHVTPD